MLNIIFQRIARAFPKLGGKLRRADIKESPERFIKKTVISAVYITTGIIIFLFFIFSRFGIVSLLYLISPFTFALVLFYLFRLPDVIIRRKEKEISKEIVFAGRFLVIEIESGVPLYDAFVNISKNYESIGKYFKEIIDKINMGTNMEDAINEAIELTPSSEFRRVLWQIINSLRTGSNIADSLVSVIDQITREQYIRMKEYGRKLNPMVMFYMIIAVILPSLGITIAIVLSTFMNIELSLTILLFVAFFLGFIQFMFLSIIKFSRPAIEF